MSKSEEAWLPFETAPMDVTVIRVKPDKDYGKLHWFTHAYYFDNKWFYSCGQHNEDVSVGPDPEGWLPC